MPALKLSILLRLETYEIPSIIRPEGPLFHRWIPNGRNDALVLTQPDEADQLSVWFERRAENRGGFLHWNSDGVDFDEAIMARQGKIDAGFLFGEVTVAKVSQKAFSAVSARPIAIGQLFGNDIKESTEYVRLAKRLLGIIQPRVSRFLETLRDQYGQYWLRPLQSWDSRTQTLGSYCAHLGLCWWNKQDGNRYRFVPTNLGSTIRITSSRYNGAAEYLTETDWRQLQKTRCLHDPALGTQMLGHAGRLLDHDDVRAAYVDVVTALELAVDALLRVPKTAKAAAAALHGFTEGVPLKRQLTVVLVLMRTDPLELETVLRVVDTRNKVVHEGYKPSVTETHELRMAMRSAARMLGLAAFKTPGLNSSNSLSPPIG